MEEFNITTAVIIFVTYILIDILYAAYIIFVANGRAFLSALVSSGIYGLIAFGVVTFSRNFLYLIPLVAGAFIGTYVVVKFQKKISKS
ncbi:hypothetical protein EB008_02940 [bacterium]|nr:hypothetical protein [bacterium]